MTGSNGHNPDEKALDALIDQTLDMAELEEPDSILSGTSEQPVGVLKGLLVVPDDKDEAIRIKKILLIASLISDDEAMKTVAVINEFKRYGVPLDIVEYALLAKCAVSNNKQRMSRAELAAQALMRREIAMSRNWKDNDKRRSKDESPIA